LFGEATADHDAILVDGEGKEGGLRRGGEEGDAGVGALEPVDDESGVFGEGFGIEAAGEEGGPGLGGASDFPVEGSPGFAGETEGEGFVAGVGEGFGRVERAEAGFGAAAAVGAEVVEEAGFGESGHDGGDDGAFGIDVEDFTAEEDLVTAFAEEDVGGREVAEAFLFDFPGGFFLEVGEDGVVMGEDAVLPFVGGDAEGVERGWDGSGRGG
jgi:hypothetical protein